MKRQFLFVVFCICILAVFAADDTKTKSADKSESILALFMKLDGIDYVRSGAIIAAFLATAFCGKETWMFQQTASLFAYGAAWFLFPDALLGYMSTAQINFFHFYLGQVFGITLLVQAVVAHFLRLSKDEAVHDSMIYTGAISGLTVVTCMVMNHLKFYSLWNVKHVSFGILGASLMTIAALVQLSKTRNYKVSVVLPQTSTDKHLLVDALLSVIVGFVYYGFPDVLLKSMGLVDIKPDGVHVQLLQGIAAGIIGYIFMDLNAMSFKNEEDKKTVLLAKVLVYTAGFPLFFIYDYRYGPLISSLGLPQIISMLLSLAIYGNALCGYLNHFKFWSKK